jgi:hypothetical protein
MGLAVIDIYIFPVVNSDGNIDKQSAQGATGRGSGTYIVQRENREELAFENGYEDEVDDCISEAQHRVHVCESVHGDNICV